ncbi:hypothetical protein SAMN04490355_1005107 [Pelosinus propionicus DSM 13327]|uniref:Uncharacterized protein n=1 Tax=Pelosinus propionicus DSM 13327 TaxID=1123291 RepID=A0A1I4HXT3_9FIRM|nr:hypothetical protein SAMN04490355_1005107 [Pelosinus propionicus DSM 13327]
MKQRNNLLLKRPIGRPHVAVDEANESRLVVHHNHWISKLCTRFFRTPAQTFLILILMAPLSGFIAMASILLVILPD